MDKYCWICVNIETDLENVNDTDENGVSHATKLMRCTPQQEWKDDFNICKRCIEKLNIAYTFIQLCIQSEELRNKQRKCLEQKQAKHYCEICEKVFKSARNLRQHNVRLHKNSSLKHTSTVKQFICEKEFKPKRNLCHHNIRIHQKPEITKNSKINEVDEVLKENLKEEDTSFITYLETNNTSDSEDQKDEIKVDDGQKDEIEVKSSRNNRCKIPFTCEYCGKISHRRQHHLYHIRSRHTFEKPYKCDLCDASFTNSHSLLVHKRNHKNEKPFICSSCGKCFVCSGDLHHHSKIHLNKREYKCSICNKGFNTASCLRAHNICVHTDPSKWTYACTHCPRKFPIKTSLKDHLKRHVGIKEVSCHICSKSFYNKQELRKHFPSHSDERKFRCDICKDRGYKTQYALKKHMKITHNIGDIIVKKPEKKIHCPMCPKTFAFKYKLQRHICTHTELLTSSGI
ncbi:unnamed protein product [Acanthoscelides obtectus]|uniref:C2H2-type domain-containing protein n=1 Tax=Acanthoscelides obtectus TaxID=200917 RepID=A0A9P0JUK4_ACAOB|nr:unnamed protein product [Acanthoscelides obtectus]CAK1640795.1 Zinc finger protein 226 [Acanthoscelides obtectus]